MPLNQYATKTDVQAEFKGLTYDLTGGLAGSTVDEWCVQASATIDSYLSGRYQVPISSGASPYAAEVVKGICIALVKPRVQGAIKIQTGDKKTSQQGGATGPYDNPMKMLADYRDKKMNLTDAVAASAAVGVKSWTNDNQDSNQAQPTPSARVFRVGKDQW